MNCFLSTRSAAAAKWSAICDGKASEWGVTVQRGFLYLLAVMDWATRRVLSWRLSNTLGPFLHRGPHGSPGALRPPRDLQHRPGQPVQRGLHLGAQRRRCRHLHGWQGRCLDKIFIERLWRSLKYEAVYLHELTDAFQAQRLISRWFTFCDRRRPHSALKGSTPAETYDKGMLMERQPGPRRSPAPLPAPPEQQDVVNRTLAA